MIRIEHHDPSIYVARFEGYSRLDQTKIVEIKEQLMDVVELGAVHLVLDLSEIQFIDSEFLHLTAILRKYLRNNRPTDYGSGREKGMNGGYAVVWVFPDSTMAVGALSSGEAKTPLSLCSCNPLLRTILKFMDSPFLDWK